VPLHKRNPENILNDGNTLNGVGNFLEIVYNVPMVIYPSQNFAYRSLSFFHFLSTRHFPPKRPVGYQITLDELLLIRPNYDVEKTHTYSRSNWKTHSNTMED
jgi:hypothetical protein